MPEVLYVEHRINRRIPDLGDVDDVINFPLDLTSSDIELTLDIRHTWRGDLRVVLTSPHGEVVVLWDQSGGGEDDIVRTFRASTERELLGALLGKPAKGDWRLQISDAVAEDVGVLMKSGIAVSFVPGS